MINYALYRIGQWLALVLPLKFAYGFAVFVSDLHYLVAREDRRAVAENLRAIFPEKTDAEIRSLRLRMFRNFAKYLVDFFRQADIDRAYIERNVRLQNMHYFDEALATGKGGIVVTAHLGNWELGGVVIAGLGYPFWVVALPHKSKRVNDFFNAQRQRQGMTVIPLGRAAITCLKALHQNKLLGLVGDRDFAQSGTRVDFLGRPTIFPEGPAAFALKTGSLIVPGFMIRNSDDSFTLSIEKPIACVPTGDRQKDLEGLIGRYKAVIEEYVRRYPDQWFMFRRFWAV